MKVIEVPQGWFLATLVIAWGILLIGTAFVFLFPIHLAPTLGKPLWVWSFFVVIGTWVYSIILVTKLVRRLFC